MDLDLVRLFEKLMLFLGKFSLHPNHQEFGGLIFILSPTIPHPRIIFSIQHVDQRIRKCSNTSPGQRVEFHQGVGEGNKGTDPVG